MQHALRPFEDKVALVTGSSRGIGRVIAAPPVRARRSSRRTRHYPGVGRAFGEAESLAAVAQAIAAASGHETMMAHGDLTDESSVKRVVGEVMTRFGRIDILVNNAGGDIGARGTAAPRVESLSLTTPYSSRGRRQGGHGPQSDLLHAGMPGSGAAHDASALRSHRQHQQQPRLARS